MRARGTDGPSASISEETRRGWGPGASEKKLTQRQSPTANLIIVANWFEELKQRVPIK